MPTRARLQDVRPSLAGTAMRHPPPQTQPPPASPTRGRPASCRWRAASRAAWRWTQDDRAPGHLPGLSGGILDRLKTEAERMPLETPGSTWAA